MELTLPEIESNFWSKIRLKSYKNWPYQSSKLQCNPERMAAAGFVCIGGIDEPDLVECFICHKQLDGWEATDDPWEEHRKHKANCPYILLGKQKEETWTIEELYSIMKEYYTREIARQKELMINDFKKQLAHLSEEIPIIYRSSRKNNKN